jgi:glycerophosphoryl diester phosphodiesterase
MSADIEVVGHRGWPARYPDNTIAGVIAAATVADAVEIDVRRSSDGKLVVSHDPWIGGLVVAETRWEVLGNVDLGQGHRPVLVDEVIGVVPDLRLQLEIKNHPWEPGFEPDHRHALEAAERARPGDLVTSFNWSTLDAVRRTFPEVATGVLVAIHDDMSRAVAECLDGGHRALLPALAMPTLDLVLALETGLDLYPWVVNDPERVRELADLGVSGIITDDPALARAALSEVR